MSLQRTDVGVGAYVRNIANGDLYRIAQTHSTNGRTQVVLEDAASPLTSERLPDPDVPGKLGASMFLKPHVKQVPLAEAQRTLDLVVAAPHGDETASEDEYGAMGTQPT